MRSFLIALCLVLASGPAFAADAASRDAERLFAEGRYEAAATRCGPADVADCWATAARAVLAASYFSRDSKERLAAAKRAENLAREALARDDRHVEGHIELGLALGRRGAEISAIKAHVLRLAPRARKNIERALELDPESAWALAVLGGWHLEVIRRGGGGVYRATIEGGVAAFEKAMRLEPENPAIAYQFGLMLTALDDPALDVKARSAFEAALQGAARTAFEQALQDDAMKAAAALDAAPDLRAEILAARL
ncbi:MAG: hypothetical protein AAFV51_12955 [Pseudomonadota bacterium]